MSWYLVDLSFLIWQGQIKFKVCSLGVLSNPLSPVLGPFLWEEFPPFSHLSLADEWSSTLVIVVWGHVDGLVVPEVVNVEMGLQLRKFLLTEGVAKKFTHLRQDGGHPAFHVFKPQELHVWVVTLLVARLKQEIHLNVYWFKRLITDAFPYHEMWEVVSRGILAIPEEFSILVKGPWESLLIHESFVMVERDTAIHGVSGDKDNLTGVQQVGWQHFKGQVGLDHSVTIKEQFKLFKVWFPHFSPKNWQRVTMNVNFQSLSNYLGEVLGMLLQAAMDSLISLGVFDFTLGSTSASNSRNGDLVKRDSFPPSTSMPCKICQTNS